jgi:hypothetical protein
MIRIMRISSRRFLSIAAVLMLLEAILHTIGFLLPVSDPALIALERSMRDFHFDMSMNPSMFDAYMTLVLMMTITFTAFGILNLVLAAAPDIPAELLRRIVWVNAVWVAASIALSWFYGVPPPLICGIVAEVPRIGALLTRN